MTRKNPSDVVQVVSALRLRGNLRGWQFCAIENRAPQEVASIMKSSRIYMSFGAPEGISLSCLEAMMAGCKIVGYSGMGCREYFDNSLCDEIPQGDVIKYVCSVERIASAFESGSDDLARSVARAQEYVRDTYSPERESRDLYDFYKSVI